MAVCIAIHTSFLIASFYFCDGARWRDSKTLGGINSELPEFFNDFFAFYELGNGFDSDFLCHLAYGRYLGEIYRVTQDMENDTAINFQKVHFDALEQFK